MLNQNLNSLEHFKPLNSTKDLLFLHRAVRHGTFSGQISRSLADQIQDQAVQISHKLITMRTTDFGTESLKKAVEQGIRFLSLGLAYATTEDLNKATDLIIKNPLVKFFQIGNTLITQLKKRATQTIESCLLRPPTLDKIPATITQLKPIFGYNAYEGDFLEGLKNEQITIRKAEIALVKPTTSSQPICHLTDLNIANQQIDYLLWRLIYLQSLPKLELFCNHRRVDGELDELKKITLALITNLLLFGVVDFDDNSWKEYRETKTSPASAWGKLTNKAETETQLSEWVHRLFSDLSHPVRDYINQYWQHCWHSLFES